MNTTTSIAKPTNILTADENGDFKKDIRQENIHVHKNICPYWGN